MLKHIGILKPNTLVSVLNWEGIPLILIYIFSMLVYPWFCSSCDWKQVQSVWSHWQSLNVGMLAFLSSLIAFNISRFNAKNQRERDFVAARAFLPEALSELTTYLRSCSSVFSEAWTRAKARETKSPLQAQVPSLPEAYKSIFSRCISFAEPDVGEHLAYILMRLQIHDSRLRGLTEGFSEGSSTMVMPQNIISHMYCLAQLQALVNKTFGFARGLDEFNSSRLTLEEFRTAYINLDIQPEEYENLIGFTERAVERND